MFWPDVVDMSPMNKVMYCHLSTLDSVLCKEMCQVARGEYTDFDHFCRELLLAYRRAARKGVCNEEKVRREAVLSSGGTLRIGRCNEAGPGGEFCGRVGCVFMHY